MQPEFQQLEKKLREHEVYLKQETAERYRRLYRNHEAISGGAAVGSAYLHDLVLVAVALFPGDDSIDDAFRWASQPQGLLKRENINTEHLQVLLHTYFEVASTLLKDKPTLLSAARQVEQKMLDVLMRSAKRIAAAGA